ncbi:MAG: serine hydrolase [Solirubrobacteraceae bacterium]|nr:MAG: hypothetical protein DLM63_03655 [Solirubrobacterales bacterium]
MISLERLPRPPIPRLPLVADPLRRIRVPADLGSVTSRALEVADVEALGMTSAGVERIWAAAEQLYRSGMYPAVALCVRRHNQVVLDRAIGQARGNGPSDSSNDPRFLTGVVPAGNVVTTANELSRFFDLLGAGGELDGVRVLESRTIRRAISERSFREIDLTLLAPLRHASGLMLGAKAVSLFGPDTEQAFGHLGYTNVLGWADPERALSVGLITSGKPILHPALADLWLLARAIGQEAPKLARAGTWFTDE